MNINCCHLALAYIVITLPVLAILANRTFKLKARVAKVEKKNGHEQAQINEIKLEVAELKKQKNRDHE